MHFGANIMRAFSRNIGDGDNHTDSAKTLKILRKALAFADDGSETVGGMSIYVLYLSEPSSEL